MQTDNQRRELLFGDVLQFVQKHDQGGLRLPARLADHFQQGLQVVFQHAVIGQPRFGRHIEAHLDVVVFHFQGAGQPGKTAEGPLCHVMGALDAGEPQQRLS